jgi:hypothetical protein
MKTDKRSIDSDDNKIDLRFSIAHSSSTVRDSVPMHQGPSKDTVVVTRRPVNGAVLDSSQSLRTRHERLPKAQQGPDNRPGNCRMNKQEHHSDATPLQPSIEERIPLIIKARDSASCQSK